jgi:chromosome segregation ATPase
MKEDAQSAYDEAKSNLEQIEALKDRTSAFGEKYEAFKDSGEGGKELIEEAENIAQAMKDAGAEEEANVIHLAALRAEARGTADDFNALADTIKNSQSSASETVNNEAIASADKLLATENTSAKEVIEHQEKIKAAQEELNNLDPLDAGYEAEKERLERLIATLKDAKLAEEELVDAANTEMNSKLDIGAQKVAEAEGQNMHVFQAQDAGTEVLTPGAMN